MTPYPRRRRRMPSHNSLAGNPTAVLLDKRKASFPLTIPSSIRPHARKLSSSAPLNRSSHHQNKRMSAQQAHQTSAYTATANQHGEILPDSTATRQRSARTPTLPAVHQALDQPLIRHPALYNIYGPLLTAADANFVEPNQFDTALHTALALFRVPIHVRRPPVPVYPAAPALQPLAILIATNVVRAHQAELIRYHRSVNEEFREVLDEAVARLEGDPMVQARKQLVKGWRIEYARRKHHMMWLVWDKKHAAREEQPRVRKEQREQNQAQREPDGGEQDVVLIK
jgi:plasmid stability protein